MTRKEGTRCGDEEKLKGIDTRHQRLQIQTETSYPTKRHRDHPHITRNVRPATRSRSRPIAFRRVSCPPCTSNASQGVTATRIEPSCFWRHAYSHILFKLGYLGLGACALDDSGEIEDWKYALATAAYEDNMVAKNLPGSWNGKSSDASRIAKKIHHPHQQVTNAKAPPAMMSVLARDTLAGSPYPIYQKAAVSRPKAGTRVKKIMTNIKLVRRAQIR